MKNEKKHCIPPVKMILISVVLVVIGVLLLLLAIEKTKTGWYEQVFSMKRTQNRMQAFDVMISIILLLLGCNTFYRGMRGKGFQLDISNMFSSYEDGSLYACPHCGGKLEPGQMICPTCGKKAY
ncbi:MAG: hypothetical protein ACI4AO_02595 [Anaerotignum sp.]